MAEFNLNFIINFIDSSSLFIRSNSYFLLNFLINFKNIAIIIIINFTNHHKLRIIIKQLLHWLLLASSSYLLLNFP